VLRDLAASHHEYVVHSVFNRWPHNRLCMDVMLAYKRKKLRQHDQSNKKIRKFRQTCGASAGDTVTAKSLPADSPHCERVVWSRSQTIHCDCVRSSWRRHWVADKLVACRWLCCCPSERQRSSCWAHKLTSSRNKWCCVKHTKPKKFWTSTATSTM